VDKDKIEIPGGMTLSDAELEALADSDEKEFAEGMGPEGPEDVKPPAAGEEEGGGEEAGSEGDGEDEGSDAGAGDEEGNADEEGFGEDEGDEASKAGGEEGAAEGDETASGDKDKKSAAEAAAKTPPPEGEEKKDEAKGTEGTGEGEEDEDDSPLPVLLTPPPKADLEKAEAELKAAKEKFDEGEIEFSEYQKTYEKYLTLKNRTDLVNDFNSQAVTRQWEADQDRFLRAYPSLKDNQMLRGVLANTVNDLFKTPEWADKPGMKVLNEAKRLIEAGLGIKITRKGEGTASPPRSEKAARQEKGRELARKAVETEAEKARNAVTLRGAPAAASNTPEKNPWAHIDRLEGEAYQRAINNMTDAQRQAYEDAH